MSGRSWKFGLAPKLVGALLLVALLVAGALGSRAARQLSENLDTAFVTKGEAIAVALAASAEQNAAADISTVQSGLDSSKGISGVRYIFILDEMGEVVAHTFTPVFPAGLEKINPVAVGELTGAKPIKVARGVDLDTREQQVHSIDVAAPVSGGALGVVHVGMDQDAIDASVSSLWWSIVLWSALVALVATGLGLALVRTIIVPLRELTRATAAIVSTGDLTHDIKVRSRDEIGELAASFQQLLEKLRNIPRSLQSSVQALGAAVQNLTDVAEQQGQTISRQASALQETQVTAQEIKQTSLVAAGQAEAVLQVAEKAEAVGRSGEDAIEQSLGGLQQIRQEVADIAKRIAALSERTSQIGGITESVKDLADQSNVLAINAAIEAARAGEQGRGFAVVAREIRSLSDQSIHSTEKVKGILRDVSEAVQVTVAMGEQNLGRMDGGLEQIRASGDNLRQLSGIVRENSAAVRQIAVAVTQQNAGIAQIFEAVTELNGLMDDAVKRLESTNQAVGAIRQVSDQVSGIVRGFQV